MTGWRLGAAIGPAEIVERIARLNTNEESCTTQFVQWAGVEAITGDQSGPMQILDVLRARRDAAIKYVEAIPGIRVHTPNSAFYIFPEVTAAMARTGHGDVGEFALDALHNTGMSFCNRRHFGRPFDGEKGNYIRLAYSGINIPEIERGLKRLGDWISAS